MEWSDPTCAADDVDYSLLKDVDYDVSVLRPRSIGPRTKTKLHARQSGTGGCDHGSALFHPCREEFSARYDQGVQLLEIPVIIRRPEDATFCTRAITNRG